MCTNMHNMNPAADTLLVCSRKHGATIFSELHKPRVGMNNMNVMRSTSTISDSPAAPSLSAVPLVQLDLHGAGKRLCNISVSQMSVSSAEVDAENRADGGGGAGYNLRSGSSAARPAVSPHEAIIPRRACFSVPLL